MCRRKRVLGRSRSEGPYWICHAEAVSRVVQFGRSACCGAHVHRHSESKTASIRIVRESNQISLEIKDQGKGMSPARLVEIQSGRSGIGISGMRERLRQFEGTMHIESDGAGTRIFATIPLPKTLPPEFQSKAEPLPAATSDI